VSHYTEEVYTFYKEHVRTARKEHRCAACDEPISPGHKYTIVSWLYDGEAESLKRCRRCQLIHEHLRPLGYKEDMWPDERLGCGEEYRQHWGHDPPEEIARLAFLTPDEVQKLYE